MGTTLCSLEVGLGFKVRSGLGSREREREREKAFLELVEGEDEIETESQSIKTMLTWDRQQQTKQT